MQLRGWRLTRASRVVIIVLVVQILGLGVLLPVVPAADAAGITAPSGTQPLDAALPVAVSLEAGALADVGPAPGAPRIPLPDPVPLPRRLPRAPPAP